MAVVSHDNKFIFIHIPKTAGTSLNEALTKEPAVTPQKLGRKLRYLPTLLNPKEPTSPKLITPPIEKHAKALNIKQTLGKKLWGNYFTFTFVRNPWDMMVSSYKWWLQKAHMWPHLQQDICRIQHMKGFREFLQSPYGAKMINEQQGSIMDWITDEDDRIIVDYIGKFESLEQDFSQICKIINMPKLTLPHSNVTNREDYRKYYDDQTREWVAKRFSRTVKQFNYSF